MIWSLIIGAVVGFIASKIMGADSSWLLNIVIGVAGSFVGRFLFGLVGISGVGLGGMLISIIGACIFIAVARKIG